MMARLSILLSFSAFIVASIAAPAPTVLHEKRAVPINAYRLDRIDPEAVIPFRIALNQQNLDDGHDRLMAISHPSSSTYGQHMTAEEVHDFFAPAQEAVDTVKNWLVSSGISAADIKHYANKGWLAVDIPAKKAEELFSAQYYEHHVRETVRIGCDEYSLPPHVAIHVDFVKPGVKLSAPLKKQTLEKRANNGTTGGYRRLPHFPQQPYPNYVPPPQSIDIAPNLRNCGANITIQCLQALYKLPRNNYSDPANAMGLYETYDTFSVEDISLFFAKFVPYVDPSTVPEVISVDGGKAPVAASSPRNGGESDIDIDLSVSIIYPQKVIVYQVDDLPNAEGKTGTAGFLNTFLDSIDGSYCNYTAFGITGNSPGIDPVYPDTKYPKGYKGQLECGTYQLTRVVSISYGEPEIDLPKKYVERQCNEIMKLGMQGHSILNAAGDYGVASFPGDNGNEFGCLPTPGESTTFPVYNPDYPSGCPYMTVVGGTRLYPTDTVLAPESAMQVNLTAFNLKTGVGPTTAPYDYFATGGGFSNYFTPPSYQAKAVSNYLANYAPTVPSYVANSDASNVGVGGVYNRAGRGYPDVAANGAFLRVFVNATEATYFGTSLSSPIFGAVITLLNEQRTAAGKGPIGFINPALYANPDVMNDITNGSNPNCGSSGFKAAPGWDPVTGLGTPNYPKMLKLFMSLP